MPVYLNTKNNFSIPRDDESDISDSETYLRDPEMFFDRLPQPFRMINKIVNIICNEAWTRLIENVSEREMMEKRKSVENVKITNMLDEGHVQCMCLFGKNEVIMGRKNGLTLWYIDDEKQTVLDQCFEEGFNVSWMRRFIFSEELTLVATINEDGSARLLTVIFGRIYFIKEFTCSKEGDNSIQITCISLDDCCSTLCISYDEGGGEEQWLEVYRIKKDIWTKEIGVTSRAYQDHLNAQSNGVSEESTLPEPIPNESVAVLDRNGLRVSPPSMVMKVKFPDSGIVPGVSNIPQLQKLVDSSGQCLGLGLNHCITKNMVEARIKWSGISSDMAPSTETRVIRIANVIYLKANGFLIPEVNVDESASEGEYVLMIVWWTHCQHLLMYALNRVIQKDPWTKPDGVRSFSCPITACELSPDSSIISVGLQNGLFILIDISSGLTRLVKKVSNDPIKEITFLHFQRSDRVQYLNVIDEKHAMYCIGFSVATFSDSAECSAIESDLDADSVVKINRFYDLALSSYRDGSIILRDMFSGTPILNIEIPSNMTISCPWNPIFVLVGENCLCVQAWINDDTEEEENVPATLLYKINLDTFQYGYKSQIQAEESESKSYVLRMADEYLLKRRGLHDLRQSCLQQYLANLHQYLP